MEQVYRRHRDHTSVRSHHATTTLHYYKQTVIRQSVFCLLLFMLCLLIKLYPEKQLDIARNSIQLILNADTDFAGIPQQIQNFFYTYVVNKESDILEGKDVLTALVTPVDAAITSPFGVRTHPTDGAEKFHYGVDLGAAEGEKIKCAADGTAVEVGESADYGHYILVAHADEIYTLYAHCQSVLPQTGDVIQAGQVIATVGATGNTTGPHLHFEIRNGETYLDPADFIDCKQDDAHD